MLGVPCATSSIAWRLNGLGGRLGPRPQGSSATGSTRGRTGIADQRRPCQSRRDGSGGSWWVCRGKYLERRVTTSTLGMGLGYDESILSAIAKQGAGNEHFAENADSAAGLIAQECGELLSQAFLSCRLKVKLATGARKVTLRNEFSHRRVGDELQIDLGGFQAEQMRALVLQFRPKPTQRAGRRKLATLEFEYVQASDPVSY